MSYSNGKITAPISASDPYMVMGVGQYNGVYDVAYICGNTHGKINPFSKYKPVKFDGVNPQESNSFWYRSKNELFKNGAQPCGIKMRVLNLIVNDENYIYNIRNEYTWKDKYVPPVKNEDWSRLIDFEKYNHNETSPFECSFPQGDIWYVTENTNEDSKYLTSYFNCNVATNANQSVITVADISRAFRKFPPSDKPCILGFIAYSSLIGYYIKTKAFTENSINLVDLNISKTNEAGFWESVVDRQKITIKPIIANKEIPLWTSYNSVGEDFECITFPDESNSSSKEVYYKKQTTPIEIDFAIQTYKYGSNFTEPHVPLFNPVKYNGANSYCDVEVEVIDISGKSHISSGVIPPLTGYKFRNVNGFDVDYSQSPVIQNGYLTKVMYNGVEKWAYRFKQVRIKEMYKLNSISYKANSGMIDVDFKTDIYKSQTSLYIYCEG